MRYSKAIINVRLTSHFVLKQNMHIKFHMDTAALATGRKVIAVGGQSKDFEFQLLKFEIRYVGGRRARRRRARSARGVTPAAL